VLDFLIQFVFQVIFEVVFDWLASGIDKASKTRPGRIVLWLLFSVLPALGIGWLWGRHVDNIEQSVPPWSMWISIVVGVVLIALSIRRRNKPPLGQFRVPRLLQFSTERLVMLGITNFVAAAGMAWGYYG
jgi:undecaprenyl pyrophosphate phosphatase UppP